MVPVSLFAQQTTGKEVISSSLIIDLFDNGNTKKIFIVK